MFFIFKLNSRSLLLRTKKERKKETYAKFGWNCLLDGNILFSPIWADFVLIGPIVLSVSLFILFMGSVYLDCAATFSEEKSVILSLNYRGIFPFIYGELNCVAWTPDINDYLIFFAIFP